MFFLIPAFGIPSPRHGGSLKKYTDKFGEGQLKQAFGLPLAKLVIGSAVAERGGRGVRIASPAGLPVELGFVLSRGGFC